jgi:hypothetical protein
MVHTFANLTDYKSIIAKECRILIYIYLLRRLEVNDSIWHVHISNIVNLLSILFLIAHYKIYKFWNIFWRKIEYRNSHGPLYLSISCWIHLITDQDEVCLLLKKYDENLWYWRTVLFRISLGANFLFNDSIWKRIASRHSRAEEKAKHLGMPSYILVTTLTVTGSQSQITSA